MIASEFLAKRDLLLNLNTKEGETPEEREARSVRVMNARIARHKDTNFDMPVGLFTQADTLQTLTIDKFEQDGYKVNKFLVRRDNPTGPIGVMLTKKNMFNQETYKHGTRIAMVYALGVTEMSFNTAIIKKEYL